MSDKNRLGKGLDSLLGSLDSPAPVEKEETEKKEGLTSIPLDKIRPNPGQPRKHFSSEALDELAESIRQQGVLQPILVEPLDEDLYSIVAGERRFRAAQRAQLKRIPGIIRSFSTAERLEIALIENIQRENLDPIEEAMAYKELMGELKLNQEEISHRVGKKRSTIANSLRLLNLPSGLQEKVAVGTLSSGHARALLSLEGEDQQLKAAQEIEEKGLSVREAERLAKSLLSGEAPRKTMKTSSGISTLIPELIDIEQRFIEKMGTKVEIKGTKDKGKIEISYLSMDDLERVMDLINI